MQQDLASRENFTNSKIWKIFLTAAALSFIYTSTRAENSPQCENSVLGESLSPTPAQNLQAEILKFNS
jgi:hypothetical protein